MRSLLPYCKAFHMVPLPPDTLRPALGPAARVQADSFNRQLRRARWVDRITHITGSSVTVTVTASEAAVTLLRSYGYLLSGKLRR